MKTPLITLLLLITLAAPADGSVVVTPQQPRMGDQLEFVYTHGSLPPDAKEITLELLLLREEGRPKVLEQPMEKTGATWKAEVELDDEQTVCMLFQFVSGEMTDDNGGKSWDLLVYDEDGKAVRSAHVMNAYTLSSTDFYGFRRPADLQLAKAEVEKDLALYPDNLHARTTLWQLMMKEENQQASSAAIGRQLDGVYEQHKGDEKALVSLLPWYSEVGQPGREDSLRAVHIASSPKGLVAENTRMQAVYDEQDREKRVELYDAFRKEFPKKGDDARNSDLQLLRFLTSAKQYDRAVQMLEAIPDVDGGSYNAIAWGMIEKGENLETGVELARKGMERFTQAGPEDKPEYLSVRNWKRNQRYGLGQVADTYAYGLEQLGRYAEAEAAYETAYESLEGQASDVNERLVGCYVKNKNYAKAIETSRTCVEKGHTTDALIEHYRTAFLANGGSEKEFTAELETHREAARAAVRKKMMEERVNEPAVDFTLDNLYGGTTKLSDLKGKVVIVDFWATWCGPCLQSFPYLQQVYERYKENKDVVILTLNTWENKKGPARVAHVKKFMEENKYTFPVLMDETTVNAYKVEGIPTKFLIDRNGFVQFKSIGFEGGQKMVDEMTIQIEMLLSKEFYSSR